MSKNFFWGASTSAYQIEGGITNQWSEWENQNAQTLAQNAEREFGYLPKWNEIKKQATDSANYINGDSVSHWHRWQEDFEFIKEIGLNAYRMSIEWSRLEPQNGVYDESAWQQYREMLTWLRDHNVEPFLTLWHWGLPLWAYDRGGWLSSEVRERFYKLVSKVTAEFGDLVKYFLILNEPGLYCAFSYVYGSWPPQKRNQVLGWRVQRQLINVHNHCHDIIKVALPDSYVSSANNVAWYEAGDNNLLTRIHLQLMNWTQLYFIRKTKQDFIGLNHYFHNKLFGAFSRNENKITSDLGWEIMTESLLMTLRLLKQFNLPIIITENGLADARDQIRAEFIEQAVVQIKQAQAEAIVVRGYLYWSLLDNFEWDKGFWPQFGLVEVDSKTKNRSLRRSAIRYGEIIRSEL